MQLLSQAAPQNLDNMINEIRINLSDIHRPDIL